MTNIMFVCYRKKSHLKMTKIAIFNLLSRTDETIAARRIGTYLTENTPPSDPAPANHSRITYLNRILNIIKLILI